MPLDSHIRLNRRDFLKASGALLASSQWPQAAVAKPKDWPAAPLWMQQLGRSEQGGRDYLARVEGEVPSALRGEVFRNGPGLFERDGYRKRHLLDGDGLVQRLSFSDAGVRYQNRFVSTEKYQREEAEGRFIYATWTTRRRGGFLNNIGGNVYQSRGGVSVIDAFGHLVARDDTGPHYFLDPQTLAVLRTEEVGDGKGRVGFKGKTKFDPVSGEWLLAGQQFTQTHRFHVASYNQQLELLYQRHVSHSDHVYIHDFFATPRYFVLLIHPCVFHPTRFLAGLESFTDGLDWEPKKGNRVVLMPRDGGEPISLQAPASFMWNTVNAFEQGDTLVADFVGYDEPDHFIGQDALMYNLMQGHMGQASANGQLRRYRIDLNSLSLREEILDSGSQEYPAIDNRRAMQAHRFVYLAAEGIPGVPQALKQWDAQSGDSQVYRFDQPTHVSEPVFIPLPGGDADEGWVISQCLDSASLTSFYALFEARHVGRGPLAKIWLEHPLPYSLHGTWRAAST